MTTLWDTTGTAVVKALAAERRSGGAVTSGIALTLVLVVDEPQVAIAEAAASVAASKHPMRILIVIRRQVDAPTPRLDAEVLIGGRLGPGEAIVMRMYGRLALHAESVTLPLLAPDAPVVTWWYGAPPERIAFDPLGVFADRRITDAARADDPMAALQQRGSDFAAGDTDLAWTRITPWRALLASAFDTATASASSATVAGDDADPSTQLLAGWLGASFGFEVPVEQAKGGGIRGVTIGFDDGTTYSAKRDGARVVLSRGGAPDSIAPFPDRELGDLLAEEMRRLDADQPYSRALSVVCGIPDLEHRPGVRTHIWNDPALVAAQQAAAAQQRDTAIPANEAAPGAAGAHDPAAVAPSGDGVAGEGARPLPATEQSA
ncbi:MAG: Glucose-6-phosphate dehydrogenase subunit [Pseudonocardiales bacterium]|nr:Glucose-6-phosphate dehydrogenase subunit [Pseudonocardiales bacterium]